ncbi:chemotaxis-specific protein-glutamate methyltransferase CheB [Dawidia soli]|uniref:Protein-glutamate methylesterase/protein-glutamine glutaminase n=1 Tax=Dawidia soli TaxID=2782352 RepID=A0AAP2DCL6_9BACT|nr:chemotaxis-specific protein-glutamate methyltransferase CheB [Dawidia soli]MBT1689534.1 chemotaxis-specific protein-glutamate methyltransferase CheB [Dawidia soli]
MANKIRTLLIDDSPFMRKVIGDIITADGELELVGTAANGREGSTLATTLKPDVVVTDMVMPEYDGAYLVRAVMDQRPVPIILLSSLEKNNVRIFDALQSGAFDFIDKPVDFDVNSIRDYRLRALIKEAARADISALKSKTIRKTNRGAHTFDSTLNYSIIAIGASTGGPSAVESIIFNLPANLQIPVVIGQHMPARFLESFAERLNNHNHLPVTVARAGDPLEGGGIYIINGDHNSGLTRLPSENRVIFSTVQRKFADFNHPSINCLFTAVAEVYGAKSIGVILTGMGKDGAEGLLRIKSKGGFTIAQDEGSSVVYGMPKAAVELGAVRQTVPLHEIPGFIVSCL